MASERDFSVRPYVFIVSFGVVSMFMDIVYEGALAVQGPLLASLGASALIVGLVSGLGEATSLAGRLFSGPLADRTQRYWIFAISGYVLTALCVPAMGFVGSLAGVSALVIVERFGKSLRTPSRDAMISHAASAVGRGKGFALHEVMDQIGAMAGPLIVAGLLSATQNDYRVALGVLIIPGLVAIAVLLVLRRRMPNPQVYEGIEITQKSDSETASAGVAPSCADEEQMSCVVTSSSRLPKLPRLFWIYTFACGTMLIGVATFGVLSFHMVSCGLVDDASVAVLYAVAMAVDAVFAALTGVAFDKLGPKVLLGLPFVCAAIPFFAYTSSLVFVIVGVVLWGASLGIQESTMRAAVANMVAPRCRASSYGMFSVATGIGQLLGGIAAGALYGISPLAIIIFSCCVEAVAFVPLAIALHRTPVQD